MDIDEVTLVLCISRKKFNWPNVFNSNIEQCLSHIAGQTAWDYDKARHHIFFAGFSPLFDPRFLYPHTEVTKSVTAVVTTDMRFFLVAPPYPLSPPSPLLDSEISTWVSVQTLYPELFVIKSAKLVKVVAN